ncbi:response regulator [Caulobacter sp. LARHSG274]
MQGGLILVVEDDVFTRFAVGDHLRDCGYEVLEAETGQEAIDLLASGAAVDVVFTDMQMPGDIDGFGVVRWLREHRPELPVLVASGHALALELASKLCDVRSTFAKPYDETHVATAVAELLDGRTAAV